MNVNINNSGVELLNTIYQNSKMGIDSIDYIFPKIKNSDLKKDLTAQMAGYLKFINRISLKFDDMGGYPNDTLVLSKIPSRAYMKLQMYVDCSESHIAEMMIENSTAKTLIVKSRR